MFSQHFWLCFGKEYLDHLKDYFFEGGFCCMEFINGRLITNTNKIKKFLF